MEKILELIEKGIITMRIVTLLIVSVTCYMWLERIPVSETQETAFLLILGFYFGGEITSTLLKRLLEEWISHFKEKH